MSFRRIPFQFSSTDPAERQAELEKRFGLPSGKNMYVDVANPLSTMNAGKNKNSSSPRLQHRVPIFLDGYDEPIKSSVDSVGLNSDKKKPNVRVIPIEIEGDCRPSSRHRTFSGPAGLPKEESLPVNDSAPLKRSMQDLSQSPKVKLASGLGVHNIPIKIEDGDFPVNNLTKPVKVANPSNLKKDHITNGCAYSKQSSEKTSGEAPDSLPEAEQKIENTIEISLQKIEDVLKELVSYELGVKKFTGTVKDKQYRYLDEMLTRCMLRLDDIETMGNNDIRSARKNAVKKVQACIDLLDSKVNATNEVKYSEEQAESQSSDVNMEEGECEIPKPEKDDCMSNDQSLKIEMTEGENMKYKAQSETEVATEKPRDMVKSSPSDKNDVGEMKNEVEMSENQLIEEQKDAVIFIIKETDVEMGDIKNEDSNTESADEVLEVEMAEGTAVESKNPVIDELQNPIAVCASSTHIESESVTIKDIDMEDITNPSKEDCLENKQIDSSNSVIELNSSKIADVKISETNSADSDSKKSLGNNTTLELKVVKDNENSSINKIITEL